MHDDRIFDFADVEALRATFINGDELTWVTMPKAWHSQAFDITPETGHRRLRSRYGMRGYIERAVFSLIMGPVEDAWSEEAGYSNSPTQDELLAIFDDVERRYAAFVAERAGRPKVGPLFSPLEACWINEVRSLLDDRNLERLRSIEADPAWAYNSTIGALFRLQTDLDEFDESSVAARQEAAEALFTRYVVATEGVMLRQAMAEAAAEAMAASEPPPQRARRRL